MTSGILCHIIRNNFVMIAVSSHTNCKGMPQAAKFSSNVHCLQHSRSMCIGWSKYSTCGFEHKFSISACTTVTVTWAPRGTSYEPLDSVLPNYVKFVTTYRQRFVPHGLRLHRHSLSNTWGELRNHYTDIYISLKQQLNRVDYREDDFFFVSVTRNGTLLGYSVDIISLISNL